jgi:Transposase DDE domain
MNKTKDKKHTIRQSKKRPSKAKNKYRLRNWSAYNRSLIRRGSLDLWLSGSITDWWYGAGRNTYSNRAIEAILMIKVVYRLPLRQTVGFIQSIFEQSGIDLSVPDYTTLSRRAQKLDIVLNKSAKDITDLILDSTGVKVYGEGEWKVRKHGWSYRRTWKKIHIAIDSLGEIRAVVVTDSDTHDSTPVDEILSQETAEITDFYGDGAYDSYEIYQSLKTRGVTGYHIPPQKNAKIWVHGNSKEECYARDENLRAIRKSTRKKWKQESCYHTRSLGETIMYRYKTTFGQHLSARKDESQKTEIMIKCNILNTFHHLCKPESYLVT